MTIPDKNVAGASPHFFRITPMYITNWIHTFEHWDSNDNQKQAVTVLSESLSRLLEKRDQVQRARGVFGPVSIYYPNAHPTLRQQENLNHATAEFFNAYYSAVSAFASLIKRHWDVFGQAPHGSVSKFLKWWKGKSPFMEEAYPLLESARSFRAMQSHTESHPTYIWHTIEDGTLTRIVLEGAPNPQGKIPEGTERRDDKWVFVAPDEDLVVSALALQLNAVIPAIEKNQRKEKAMRCTWKVEPTPDDLPFNFPVFAAEDGTVTDLVSQSIQTEIRITNSAGEEISFDEN